MNKVWCAYIAWVVAAALLGFAISAVFAGFLRLPRGIYLIPYCHARRRCPARAGFRRPAAASLPAINLQI